MEDRVKQFYQVTFLGETSELLTPEEFAQLQKECKEIYEYGKDEIKLQPFEAYVYKTMQPPEDVKPELAVPDPVIEAVPDNREKLLEKSAHKGIQAEAQQGFVLEEEISGALEEAKSVLVEKDQPESEDSGDPSAAISPIDTDLIKNKVESMPKPKRRAPGRKAKDLSKYAAMIKEGADSATVRAAMVADGFCKDLSSQQRYYSKAKAIANSGVDRVIRPETAADDDKVSVMAMARNRYQLDWDESGRTIWHLPEGMTKHEVTSQVSGADPSKVWGFYQATHAEGKE